MQKIYSIFVIYCLQINYICDILIARNINDGDLNMKKGKVLIFFVVFVVFTVYVIAPIAAEFDYYGLDLTEEIESLKLRKVSRASEKLDEYLSYCLEEEREQDAVFPDFYSGGYIDDENILHVCFVDCFDRRIGECLSILSEFGDSVVVEYRKYSFDEMQAYVDSVADKLLTMDCEVQFWAVDVQNNCVSIETAEESFSLAKRNLHLATGNSDIKVDLSIGGTACLESSTTLIAGDMLHTTGSNIEYFTLGATGTYNGSNAFLTCAHAVSSSSKVYYDDTSIPIGTITYRQYGNGDFAIGTLNSNFLPSHQSRCESSTPTIWNGTKKAFRAGEVLKKYGSYSGTLELKVEMINANWIVNSVRLTGLVRCTVERGDYSSKGDSGGPYWTKADNKFCGVNSGAQIENGLCKYVYFTPYSVINAAGFTVNAKHVGTWKDYNAANHSIYCSLCKGTFYESHAPYYNQTLGKCTRCGRTGNITAPLNENAPLVRSIENELLNFRSYGQ